MKRDGEGDHGRLSEPPAGQYHHRPPAHSLQPRRVRVPQVANNNNNILYSSQREIKAVVRSHNEEYISIILSH